MKISLDLLAPITNDGKPLDTVVCDDPNINISIDQEVIEIEDTTSGYFMCLTFDALEDVYGVYLQALSISGIEVKQADPIELIQEEVPQEKPESTG